MMTVSKGVLKAKMLEYLRRVEQTGEEIIITDNRRPVLKVVPLKCKKSATQVFENLRGKIKYKGDLLESTESEWTDLL